MLLRVALSAAVFLIIALAVYAWKRPPRRLRRLALSELGVREPAIVQFTARYCSPCKTAAPVLRTAAREAGIRYEQIDVGDDPAVARTFGIRTVPTIAVTGRGGRVIDVWTALPDAEVLRDAARHATVGV